MAEKKTYYDVMIKYNNSLAEFDKDWRKIGVAYAENDGKIIIKFGGLPFTDHWDGSMVLFPPRDKE
jgi:hypothetical protein